MNRTNKDAARAAILIHAQLADGPYPDVPIYLPTYAWDRIQQFQRQIGCARQRGWHRAAKRLTDDLTTTLDDCRRQLENAHRALQASTAEHRHVSSASGIYQDILALYDEFEEVDIDQDKHLLSVTTDRIVLEDINLGPFQIRLDWRQSGSHQQPYRVVALDPHPAAKSDDITHPHVQDELLCEGDGRSAVQAALAACRLYDFFLLISQLLHTYGRGSAYVELDDWSGIPCEDCGELVIEDERYYCQRCDTTLCSSCSVSCQGCDESFCSSCISACVACGLEYCSNCLITCRICRKQFCADCCQAGLCPQCQEKHCQDKQRHEEHEHDPSENARNEPVTAGA